MFLARTHGLHPFAVALATLSYKAKAEFAARAADSFFVPLLRLKTEFDQVRIDQRVIIRLPSTAAVPAMVGAQRQSVSKIKYKEQKSVNACG